MEIPFLALALCAISNMVIGMLWYGPLFGALWMKEMNFKPADVKKAKEGGMAGMKWTFVSAFINAAVMAFVLSQFMTMLTIVDIRGAMELSFWIWLGFVVTNLVSAVLWEGKSCTWFAINAGYWLAAIGVMGMILVGM